MNEDARWMEENLLLLAEQNIDIRHLLFEKFLAAFPQRRAAFLNLDAASRRMTDETLQMLFGLAQGEDWVWPMVAELVATHRNYGALPIEEYDIFIDMVVMEIAQASETMWTVMHAEAWSRQAKALKILVRQAAKGWDQALRPQQPDQQS